MVTKLGVMAGLEHSLPEPAGVGGASSMDSTPPKLTPSTLADMDRSLTKLTDRSAELEEFYRDQTVLLSSTPSVWPVRGYLSAAFGNRIDPFTAQKDFHPGIDISTPIGTKVQAPADGIVISIGQQGGYGNALVDRPRLRRRHALRPPRQLRGQARPARQARRRDRVRRQHRPLDGPAPPLRSVGSRSSAEPDPLHPG